MSKNFGPERCPVTLFTTVSSGHRRLRLTFYNHLSRGSGLAMDLPCPTFKIYPTSMAWTARLKVTMLEIRCTHVTGIQLVEYEEAALDPILHEIVGTTLACDNSRSTLFLVFNSLGKHTSMNGSSFSPTRPIRCFH